MKVSDLWSESAQLGFDTDFDDPVRFYQAVNRCLTEIFSQRPIVRRLEIAHYPIRPRNFYCGEARYGSDNLSFVSESAKAYSFEVHGNCTYRIENKVNGEWVQVGQAKPISAGNGFITEKGFLKIGDEFLTGEVRIRFSGDFLFVVRNVAFYADIKSNLEADIPVANGKTEYDLNDLAPNFSDLEEVPYINGRPLTQDEYGVNDHGILLIDNRICGTVTVEYKAMHENIVYNLDPRNDMHEIEIAPSLYPALVLLVASYLWLDDDAEKAQYYRVLYQERMQDEKLRARVTDPAKTNYNGW